MATAGVDPSALRIHLNELTSEFDTAMRDGQEFSKIKPLYKTIKELEWHLKVLEWEEHNNSRSERGAPYSEGRSYL